MIAEEDLATSTDPVPNPAGGTVTHLVTGILDDVKQLAQQQLAMFKSEVREDFHSTVRASQFGGAGIVFTTVGLMSLLTAIVYLLHEQFQFSMAASWGILGAASAVAGIAFALTANRLIGRFNPLPDKTFTAIKENLTWTHKK